MTKYIFVTGGVVSGLGKGITAASLGRLLKSRGLKVAAQKLDPYINVDPGTMSPFQHGEVYVTDDGAETDLDLGHYERFIDEDLNKFSNLTTGKVYWNVLNKERAGEYLGETVQVIPHITNEIKSFIYSVGKKTSADVVITEIGGTTGDIESQPFLEAIRQVAAEVGRRNCLFIHVTLVPFISGSNEPKSKPTQHSVKELRGLGISPDIIVARVDQPLDEDIRHKISMFCTVPPDCVIENRTLPVLYQAPMMLEDSHFSDIVCRELSIGAGKGDMSEWQEMLERIASRKEHVKIALVGKYVKLHDAYLSVAEALQHAGYENGCFVDIDWVDSEEINDSTADKLLGEVDGIILPGGFGSRGVEGMICAANFARVRGIPYFGICLGMQMLFEESDEVRPCRGLGLLPGRIERIETALKLPQIGWNALDILRPNAMTEGLENGSYVYFVHSFMAKPSDENDLAAVTDYGTRVPAMVARGNLFGCQFHPEKSGEVGLQMLRNFAKLTEVGK